MTDITYKHADVKWDMHDGYGNHRFIVTVPAAEYAAAERKRLKFTAAMQCT